MRAYGKAVLIISREENVCNHEKNEVSLDVHFFLVNTASYRIMGATSPAETTDCSSEASIY